MENWKDIENYDGYYQISDLGNVRSIERIVNGRKYKGCLLKKLDSYGYYSIQLRKNITKGCFYIHRLVAIHFLNKNDEKEFVNHIDKNKKNNTVNNLEWCTKSENHIHSNNGIGFLTRKFSKVDIEKIRDLYFKGKTIYFISKEFKENTGTIYNIVKNKTYKNV